MAKDKALAKKNEYDGVTTYTFKERNLFLTGLFGQNVIYNVLNTLFIGYYIRNVLFLPAVAIGVIVGVAQVWDAFNDIVMGTIVDKTRSKWGKCRPYLLFTPPVILAVSVLCFATDVYNGAENMFSAHNIFVLLWAGVAYICWGMSYTAGDIPLWGITSMLTQNEKHRRNLHALCRTVAGIASAIAVLGLVPISQAVAGIFEKRGVEGAERLGYFAVGAVFLLIASICFQLTAIKAKERVKPSKERYTVLQNLKLMWKNKPYRAILLSGIFAGPRGIMMLVAMSLVQFYYADKNPLKALLYLAILGGGLFGGMLICQMLAPKLADRFEKKTLYNFSMLIGVPPGIIIFSCYMISPSGMSQPIMLIFTALAFTMLGIGLGLYMVLQSNMIADAIDYEEYTSGVRPDAVFYSGQTFITKIGSAISTIIYGALCGLVGFSDIKVEALSQFINSGGIPREQFSRGAEIVNGFVENAAATLTGDEVGKYMMIMFFALSIPPSISSLLAVLPTRHYDLSREKLSNILAELKVRREEQN
ncbi:MAG: MFS transporter [Oscillospiraceae bacterium]|nr:MFS transporter [Oscillospiraceae bacterium]